MALNPHEGCLNAYALRGLHCVLCLHLGEALQGQTTTCRSRAPGALGLDVARPTISSNCCTNTGTVILADHQGDFECDVWQCRSIICTTRVVLCEVLKSLSFIAARRLRHVWLAWNRTDSVRKSYVIVPCPL